MVEAAALVVAVGWLAAGGISVPFGWSVAAGLALVPVSTRLAAAFAVGMSAALPNQLGAVLVVIGWVTMAEQLISAVVPALGRWLPFTGAGAAITGLHPTLGVVAGIGLFLAYLTAVVGVGVQVTRRRDIG